MSSARVSGALHNVLDDSFQKELPGSKPAVEKTGPAVQLLPSRVLLVLWIAVAALLVFYILKILVLPQFAREEETDDDVETSDEDAVLENLPLPEHGALAAEGHFAEAVRVLLLQTIVLLSLRLRVPLPESLTSREILSRLKLRGTSHDDLTRLVRCVEAGHFGGVEPAAEEYRACLAGFERLRAEPTVGP